MLPDPSANPPDFALSPAFTIPLPFADAHVGLAALLIFMAALVALLALHPPVK